MTIDSSLFIGLFTKSRLRKLFDEGETQMTKFYESVRAFYTRAMEYCLANLPINDDLLKNATFVNVKLKERCPFAQVEHFVQR